MYVCIFEMGLLKVWKFCMGFSSFHIFRGFYLMEWCLHAAGIWDFKEELEL